MTLERGRLGPYGTSGLGAELGAGSGAGSGVGGTESAISSERGNTFGGIGDGGVESVDSSGK